MTEWWNSLLIERQIFYAIGLFSLAVLLLQILLTLVGVGHHDADFSGHGEHDTGMGLLTVRTVTAFFVGFGWTGAIMAQQLVDEGLEVLALERGPWRDTPND